jgi:hypothetical protein
MESYTAYFDESGTHDGSAALVASGWVADDEQWRAFEPEWKGLIADFEISMFHTKDFTTAGADSSRGRVITPGDKLFVRGGRSDTLIVRARRTGKCP